MKPLETTPEEVLRDAIQSEVDARAFYQEMARRAATPAVRKRMLELGDNELVHRAKLERRYREVVGQPPPEPRAGKAELPPDLEKIELSQALKLALERERESESNFRFMAERVPSTTELGKLFVELAEIEWKHKTDLQAEYDTTVAPDQFLIDI